MSNSDGFKTKYHFVYCENILGVETNIRNFKWIYGSTAESLECLEYEKCKFKFQVLLGKEGDLVVFNEKTIGFQSFSWNDLKNTLSYRRKIFGKLFGYDVIFSKEKITFIVTKNYYKYIKGRLMNLHSIYYLLSDLANVVLLKNGYLTLYASAVCNKKRGLVFFAPPNTGKTFVATKLDGFANYKLFAEDLIITDAKEIYACPYTSSYRKNNSFFDSGGSFGRNGKKMTILYKKSVFTDLIVLVHGKQTIIKDKRKIFESIKILNGYLFHYYCSPIIKVLSFFNVEYNKEWNIISNRIINTLISKSNCYQIQETTVESFLKTIKKIFCGRN